MARKPKLGLPLQTLRNAPDALEGRRLRGGVFEIDPGHIETTGRLDDRLQIEIEGLKTSISRNGQRVPILVRPMEGNRYSLIYGRRRLEACRDLGIKVRAIVTEVEGDQALRDQLLENQERRDLSFIERAMVASALLDGDHLSESERTNKGVAEVLNLTEAGVSQLLSVVRTVGEDLILAIGAAPGIGRPRWEELKKCLGTAGVDRIELASVAREARSAHTVGIDETSDKAFLAVLSAAGRTEPSDTLPRKRASGVTIPGVGAATVSTGRRGKQLKLELNADNTDFVSWLEGNAPQLLAELHARWKRHED
ncbi:ParB/RepB/Spo0J family partition protein [Roseinatronobacter alkalisoli]|uniref:ParB/RepB/Spo0J family partition protein n=1 Tax=Roseinatronobacter alkalisoli TaxID=3028235 RepID=A0ABT5THE5_9RHOB|nr:ParB/RepB/Spo0J family partition protein [Roseinatronobacter sp. HJB301]MDD7973786.1 ParB/RepB/Spo0J family partition protein [Roseinatronobacter sp. HJB301]